MVGQFTKEDKAKAKSVSILQVAESLGISVHKVGSRAWDYRDVNNDGLVFNSQKNLAYLHQTKTSYDTIGFVMMATGHNFISAMKQLLEKDYKQIEIDTQVHEKVPFQDYLKNSFDKTQSTIKNYLIDERKLDPRIVNRLIDKGYIKEDGYKQIVFYWQMNGAKVGATIRGTQKNERYSSTGGYFKGIAKNSESHFGFNVPIGDKVERLYIFEAPIDALSYWTLHPELNNCLLASIDGVKTKSVFKFMNYLQMNHCQIDDLQVFLGSDNDEVGRTFANELLNFQMVRQVSPDYANNRLFVANFPPQGFKDWNETLQYQTKNHEFEKVAYYANQTRREIASVSVYDKTQYQIRIERENQVLKQLDPTSRSETLALLKQYDFERISKHDLKRFGFDPHDRNQAQVQLKKAKQIEAYEMEM
jgi:hypothetical protein